MTNSKTLLQIALVLISIAKLSGQVLYTYTAANDDALWSEPTNWSVNGSPSSEAPGINGATNDEIAFAAANNAAYLSLNNSGTPTLGLDFGESSATLSEINFETGIVAIDIEASNAQTITINGTIINSSSNSQTIGVPVLLSGNTSVTAISNSIVFRNILLNTDTLTASGSGIVTNANRNINFELSSDTAGGYGRVISTGSGFNVLDDEITFSGSYTGHLGDSFNLFSGNILNLSTAVLSLPSLSAGLVWNTSTFDSNGTISVSAVPEPSTSDLLMIGCGLLMLFFIVPTVIRRNQVLSHHPVQGGSLWWMNEMVDSE